MSKHGLTAEEWFFIELLFLATDEVMPEDAYLYKYFTECAKSTLPQEMIQSLKDKKVFAANYRVPQQGEDFIPSEVIWSKTFENNYLKSAYVMGEELKHAYPKFLETDSGKLLPANNVTKAGFLSEEALFSAYSKAIKHNKAIHEQVLRSLEWAKEQKLINYMIGEYVITKKWNDHIEVMEGRGLGQFVVKVNTMESI